MKTLTLYTAFILGLAALGAPPAHAQLAQIGTTYFELVRDAKRMYPAAASAASQRYYRGRAGSLAVLDSDAKVDQAMRIWGDALDGAWLGASRNTTDPDGPLYWTNGRRVVSSRWVPGEPNNFKGRESKLEFWTKNGFLGLNDNSPNAYRFMLVEYK